MRRRQLVFVTVVSVVLVVLVTSAVGLAAVERAKRDKIARAMQAAPESISKNATVIDEDGTILRRGSNGWTCRPTSGPGSTHPECDDEVWMRLMHALEMKHDFQTNRVGISYMLAGDDNVSNTDPFDTKQEAGEVWVQEGPHLMIVVPDPKSLEGMSDDPNNGGPYVMYKGTPYAHIMVPVGPRRTTR